MESIIALEELIKENEAKVELHQRQLQRHQSGEQPLSAMAEASAESNLEEATELVEKYKKMHEQLSQLSPEELEEKERLHTASMRKQYFDAQDSRIKLNREQDNDVKLEALRIIGELPIDVQFDDDELFEMATKSIELSLPELNELVSKLQEIKQDFEKLIAQADEHEMQELATIDFLIPIIVLHFYLLSNNIQENIIEYNQKLENNQDDLLENASGDEMLEIHQEKKVYRGFPKYQDWWIRELWLSHQAYFALYSWKNIVNNMCMSTEQKKAWSIIFDRWVFVKKLLNDKGALAYAYNFAFDSLLNKYVQLQEEFDEGKMKAIEQAIQKITSKEDLSKVVPFHDVHTPYLKYKIEKIYSDIDIHDK